MAFSKAHLYAQDLQHQATFAKALAHPERIAILRFLEFNGPSTVLEIAERSPLHYAVVSQHLKILRRQQLLHAKESYPYTIYSINLVRLEMALKKLAVLTRSLLRS